MEMRSRYLVFGLTVVLVLVATTFLLVRQLTITSATGATAEMSLNVKSGGTCDDPDNPTRCDVPLAGVFTLSVAVSSLPAGGEYIGVGTDIFFGTNLTYEPTASAEDEIVWPDLGGLIVRFPREPAGTEGRVQHGGGTASTPPFPESGHTGSIVRITLNCSTTESTHTVALLPYSDDNTRGAGFLLSNQTIVPAKTTGTLDLDLEGVTTPEPVDVAATLEINCSSAAPTPAVPAGDANCDSTVNSIDAALVLQLGAGLISSLACEDAADANGDGTINAIDAALILQFVAGLIDSL